jgi:rSAM/selenodomain-associated transferase 1
MSRSFSQALIIFARQPLPGRVKTRLTPPLTPQEATELYRCMLLDILARTEQLDDVERFLFYEEEPGAAAFFSTVTCLTSLPQRGDALGERMAAAFATVFARGHQRVAIIGTDSPDLPLANIHEAFTRLDEGETDAVFGPSEDGGYYLLAMKRLHHELFRDIRWSSDGVLRESLAKARMAGISCSCLPTWYDVDTAADLTRPGLLNEANEAPLTREFIRKGLVALGSGR